MKKILVVFLAAAALAGCAPRLIVLRTVDQKSLDRGITAERIADLEMENAALRAANTYLLEMPSNVGRKP